jgi:hypothetical protein
LWGSGIFYLFLGITEKNSACALHQVMPEEQSINLHKMYRNFPLEDCESAMKTWGSVGERKPNYSG